MLSMHPTAVHELLKFFGAHFHTCNAGGEEEEDEEEKKKEEVEEEAEQVKEEEKVEGEEAEGYGLCYGLYANSVRKLGLWLR